MAITPTFGWPTPDDTDLVRDGAAAIRAFGNAVDASANAFEFSGLVAVKHVLKTDTFVASDVAASGNVAVTGLSITHEIADENNRLIISAYFGAAGSSDGRGNTGIAVAEAGTLIGVGDASGSRTRVSAGGAVDSDRSVRLATMPSITFVHAPGSGEKTYTVRAVNIDSKANTLYVNRHETDSDDGRSPLAASALVIQEVRV